VVAAALCLIVFWADVSVLRYQRSLPPGERFIRLAWDVPFFVLTPALVNSVLHSSRASGWAKLTAGVILAIYLLSPEFWYMIASIIDDILPGSR
jgi:hypothetical protein